MILSIQPIGTSQTKILPSSSMKLSFPESPQKRLVLLFCIVFLALGTLLTREAYVLSNPASHPWAAEFVSPTSFDLAFRVSNLVKTEEFHFVLSNEQGETLSEGTVRFDPADRKAILPEEGLDAKRLSGKLLLTVSDAQGEGRTLYKVLP